jgi:quinol monooxygenase YgiN
MSITIIVELRVKSGLEGAVADRLKVAVPETRSIEGCLEITAHRDVDKPNHFVVIECWSSREAYQAYADSRRQSGALDVMAARLESPMNVTCLEAI